MKIETDYIKREAQKECYWLQGGTFDLVTWTQAMMQISADRAGSKIRQLEVALSIKTEEHDCCAADLIQWRKSAESAIGENAELRADADEFRKYLKDGESILGRLSRYNKEVEQLMRMFAAERMAKERLRDALNEILCLDTGRLGDAYVIAGFALSPMPLTTERNATDAPEVTETSHQQTETNEQRKG